MTDRKPTDMGQGVQLDKGSAQNVIIPKNLTVAHQTAARKAVPNKRNIFAVSDNIDVRKYFAEVDGVKYPTDSVKID